MSLVRQLGPIELDPCSSGADAVGARIAYTKVDDGLAIDWRVGGLVYVNPPYGRQIHFWTGKCVEQANMGAEIIALVPARTDTGWFQECVLFHSTAICWWRGRITFMVDGVKAPAPAPFPSAVVYYGPCVDNFVSAFSGEGQVTL